MQNKPAAGRFMDVKTLCLGLLSIQEACGYDLKKEFESTFKHFFPAGFGSIYPALADLAEAGLISCREIPQAGKPDRKTYRITAAGRAAFAEALENTSPQHKIRSEFLAMLYFAEAMHPERVETLLNERVDELQNTLSHIRGIEQQWGDDTPAGIRFVTGFGTAIAEAAKEYIQKNRRSLVTTVADARPARPRTNINSGEPATIVNRP